MNGRIEGAGRGERGREPLIKFVQFSMHAITAVCTRSDATVAVRCVFCTTLLLYSSRCTSRIIRISVELFVESCFVLGSYDGYLISQIVGCRISHSEQGSACAGCTKCYIV